MLHRCRSLRSPFFIIAFTCSAYLWRTFRLQLAALNGQQRPPPSFLWSSHEPPPRADDRADKLDSSDGSFSACLLIMDDNHFLIEWLAYHSFVMPLGHVIVAVDPRSQSRPEEVVKRWKSHMTIQVWDDHDYMSDTERSMHERYVKQHFGPEIFAQPDLITHRARQRLFYYKCMQSLKERGRGWVLLTDTDEYLHVNYPTVRALNLTSMAPAMSAPESVGTFLREELKRPGNNLTSPCVQIPRLRYGAKESTSRQVQRHVPEGFNGTHFLTLRWRHRAGPDNRLHNKISKTLIDLRRVQSQQLQPVTSVHRPIRELCGHRRLYILPKDQVLLINHYLGSKEQYQFRNDSRVGKERSDKVRPDEER
jgi:hypothetical protein